jgi:hypothetical protein
MKELDGINIPNLAPTTDGTCINNTAAAADAVSRGWWTCGGPSRVTGMSRLIMRLEVLNVPRRYCRMSNQVRLGRQVRHFSCILMCLVRS